MDRSSSNVIALAPVGITIGAMSRATGIPANTLRTWERRYGFPAPERSDAGQRLYSPALIGHLRLIAQALEEGHRPRQVLGLTQDQLVELMGVANLPDDAPSARRDSRAIDDWMNAIHRLDAPTFDSLMRADSARLGLLRFLTERAGPVMIALGAAWHAGEVEVFHEHWASERLRRFLTDSWMPMAAQAAGPTAVVAGLSGDRHDLGLHMAACVLAMGGWRVTYLGKDTPVEEAAAAASIAGARAIVVSVSAWVEAAFASRALYDLRSRLDSDIEVIVGGGGAPAAPTGVTRFPDLDALYAWAHRGA